MRYKITIEYDGTNYNGWQKQDGKFSIQENLEVAIKLLAGEVVEVFGSGRTDAGVHALAQVAHFDLKKEIEISKIMSGLNFYLRSQYISRIDCNYVVKSGNIQDISVIDCEVANDDFHARFSAKKRYYKYRILNRRQPTALNNNRVWHIHKELNLDKMQEALKHLVGHRDWSCFRDSDCQSKNPVRTIDDVRLYREGEEIIFEISARSFLHHMVRNIVGTLADIGLDKINLDDFQYIIDSKDRTKAGVMAPAKGLYFIKVVY